MKQNDKEEKQQMFVKVQYYKGDGWYGGGHYTYETALPLVEGDKVIAPTVNEPRQRAVVKAVNVVPPSFPCREIAEYDPEAEVESV